MAKVILVGCGNVGMAFAYALATSTSSVRELVLIDTNHAKAEGDALDLGHAAVYNSSPIKVRAGGYSECDNADIICICAGANQLPGQTRADLVNTNYKIMHSIVSNVAKTKFRGIYVVATNPVDVMTFFVQKLSGFAHKRVVGSGTTLDTARLRFLVGEELGIHPRGVHAYVLGEHGDTAFIPWSLAYVGISKIDMYLNDDKRARILWDVRNSAYDIINKKGSTYYGIGICLRDLVVAILEDQKVIRTVSCYDKQSDTYFGMPAVLSKGGATLTKCLEFNQQERDALAKSIDAIKKIIYTVDATIHR